MKTDLSWLPIIVFAPFIVALLVPSLARRLGKNVGWLVALVPLSALIYFLQFIGQMGDGLSPLIVRLDWVPLLDISLTFSLSGFALLMALLISGIGFLVVVYSIFYFPPEEDLGKFFTYILMFMGAMFGVVTCDNLIGLYVFWELTSVSSFLLIGFWHTSEESRLGALKSLMITVMGGFAILAAVVLLYVHGGSFEFSALVGQKQALQQSGVYTPIVLLLLLGAFTKSAQAPFHIWLPGAMAAPTPVSAYLHSATMVKAGIFLTAKFSLLLGGSPLWYYTIAAVGAATVFLGAMLAIRQTDLKALLAFSTVSQLGLIIPMFGMATAQSTLAGMAHILNHALFKGALFLLVGIIDHQTHTREISRLSGLAKRMPITAVLMSIAALSMAGVWPLNGFVSKELIFEALLNPPFGPDIWTWLFAIVTVLGSALTTVYCLIMIHRINFGPGRYGEVEKPRDPHFGFLFGPILLVALVVVLGVYPPLAQTTLIDGAAGSVLGEAVRGQTHFIPVIGIPLLMSVIALGLGLLGYTRLDGLRSVLGRIRPRIHGNLVYQSILDGLDKLSTRFVERHMTGVLRDYVVYTLLALAVILGYTLWSTRALSGITLDLAPASVWEVAIFALIAIGAFGVVFATSRLIAVVALGLTGMMMTLLYVILRAPDLALTQFMVESVGIVLILLAFSRLPALQKVPQTASKKAVDLVVAIGTGLSVVVLALVANGSRFFPAISDYYVENSLTLGGGRNIVNVILVDFRGFDTMGEITVLALAGLSVYGLVQLRKGRNNRP